MACKKLSRASIFIIFSAIFCVTSVFVGCSSVKETEVPEPAEQPVSVPVVAAEPVFQELPEIEAAPAEPEPEPVPEPTLAELAAALSDAWDAAYFVGQSADEALASAVSAEQAKSEKQAASAEKADESAVLEPLFTAPAALPAGDRLARKYGTALGGFLADAERGFLAEHGIETDFAFLNAELIRAGLPEGPVTKQDVERVLPFGQKIVVAEMSGEQLLELFAFIGALPQGAGGFAQVSDGVSYTLTFDETGFNAQISDVLVGAEPVDGLRTYRVALNDFVAAGGSGYSFFLREDVVKAETSVGLADAIADYCSTHADSLYMKQGERITIHGGIAE